jgi:hypothetical protein
MIIGLVEDKRVDEERRGPQHADGAKDKKALDLVRTISSHSFQQLKINSFFINLPSLNTHKSFITS